MIQVAFEKHQNIPETTWIIALIGSLLLMHPVINEIKFLSGQYILPEKDHSIIQTVWLRNFLLVFPRFVLCLEWVFV